MGLEGSNLIECEVADELRDFAIAAAKYVNGQDAASYHVSSIMSADDIEGGKKLQLVLVSDNDQTP